MNNKARQSARALLARKNGYRTVLVAARPEWCGVKLPEAIDQQASDAAKRLRGIPVEGESASGLRSVA